MAKGDKRGFETRTGQTELRSLKVKRKYNSGTLKGYMVVELSASLVTERGSTTVIRPESG